jgi:hypothetical protein
MGNHQATQPSFEMGIRNALGAANLPRKVTQYRALPSFDSAVKTSGRTFFVEGELSVPPGTTVFAATGATH